MAELEPEQDSRRPQIGMGLLGVGGLLMALGGVGVIRGMNTSSVPSESWVLLIVGVVLMFGGLSLVGSDRDRTTY